MVTGTILGTVTDESSAVLPGVTATITSPALSAGPSTVVTDEQGRYRFVGLDPGVYTLTLSLSGFGPYREELRVTTGLTIERNVPLKVGAVAETITVSGETPLVDTRNASLTATSTRETLENTPTARVTVTDFMQTLPGAAAGNPGSYNEQIQIMGSNSGEITYSYDGITVSNPRNGTTYQGGDIDSVEEIQIVPLGVSAEFAAGAGGLVSLVTKSGTNRFMGDATAYWKPNELQSRPIVLDCGCPDGQTGFNLGKMRDLTAHAGGPLLRDRLWYYAGAQVYEFTFAEPGTPLSEATSSHWHRFPLKMTWQINETTKFNQLLHLEWWGGYASGPSRAVALEAAGYWKVGHSHSYGSEFTKVFGNATILSARAGGWWEPNEEYTSVTGDLVTPSRTDLLTGYVSQGVPSIQSRLQRRDTQSVKLERYFAGDRTTHNLKFGLQFDRGHSSFPQAYTSGVQYYDFGGLPDYALFREPSNQGAAFWNQGVWVDDQMTLGQRMTVNLGVRFDHMKGISPDEPAVDYELRKTGATIQGLGDMFTWNVTAPRVGVNIKLTADGRTVLRGTYGIAYRQIFGTDFDVVHPGISPVTEAAFDRATGGYTRIISVTNSRSNLTIDPELSAPRTDAYSLGFDRQLMSQLALNVSYVYKHSDNLIGWSDIGGIYGQRTDVLPDGRTLTVFPLLNSPSQRLFQRTNRPDYFDNYQGLVTSLTKRLSRRWQAQVNLTLSRSEGLRLEGNAGRDPNDLVNAAGRINPTDRPVMFTLNGSYDIPRIDVRVSANYQNLSHSAWAPQALVSLPQGRRFVNIEPPGSYRAERFNLLYFRINKILFARGHRRLELIANVINALQNKAPASSRSYFATFNYFSPNFAEPNHWVQPRQLYFGARVNF
jgi:hypothetical protein